MSTVWIDESSAKKLEALLRDSRVLKAGESVGGLESAGDGNMNVTLRVSLQGGDSTRTIIVKQSRPFVAKYRSIEAPLERIEFESAFYEFVESDASLARKMPQKLAWIPAHSLLVLEDLGTGLDATRWYDQAPETLQEHSEALLAWLCRLHETSKDRVGSAKFANRGLRALNHAHIFDIPFRDPPEIQLDEVQAGFEAATLEVRRNSQLRSRALQLGKRYLADGTTLLHGDYYPASWLASEAGVYVIDPEFCFAGPAEFDFGIMLAHLRLIDPVFSESTFQPRVAELPGNINMELVEGFAAIEVLRRLLGVAQLPLKMGLDQRINLVERSQRVLLAQSQIFA
ncbi:MAG: phosphotransferase [Planctomycetota bacterium]